MKPMRIHHVGFILPTLQQAYDMIERLGLMIDYKGYVKAYQSKLIFARAKADAQTAIEFIIPEAGVLTEYNNGKGGIAHIAFEVEDVEAVRRECEEKGLGMLEEVAVQGTDDIIVNFLRPKFNDGILIEYVQTIGPINREFNEF